MNRLAPFLLIAFLLGGWEIACRVMQVPVYFLPPPSAVGAALLDACEDLARAAGQRWLRLGVLAANERARAFYARQGYGEILLTLEKRL